MQLTLTKQTKLAAVGYIMLVVAYALALSSSTVKLPPSASANLVALVISIPIVLYGLNCAVVGKCEKYAWIYGYIIFSWGFLFLLLLIFSLMK